MPNGVGIYVLRTVKTTTWMSLVGSFKNRCHLVEPTAIPIIKDSFGSGYYINPGNGLSIWLWNVYILMFISEYRLTYAAETVHILVEIIM